MTSTPIIPDTTFSPPPLSREHPVEDPRPTVRPDGAQQGGQTIDDNRTDRAVTSNGTYVSLYDRRVQLVAATLTAHSEMTEQAATELAGYVLYALDHIPEKVRYSGK